MIMGNHGVLFIGETVAETFTRMYYFERAAAPISSPFRPSVPCANSDEVAEKTAQQQEGDAEAEADLLNGMRAVLDVEEPDYAA
jgi:rhamnose utilization protein RhaD (predicted bifunctional aldolase and dehydrogenase)